MFGGDIVCGFLVYEIFNWLSKRDTLCSRFSFYMLEILSSKLVYTNRASLLYNL